MATPGRAAEARGDFWLDATLAFHLAAAPEEAVSPQADPAVARDPGRKSTGDDSVRVSLGVAKRRASVHYPAEIGGAMKP